MLSIAGGANGIGAAIVRYCISRGAYVFFGDVAATAGQTLADEICLKDDVSPPRACFKKLDVLDYDNILAFFDAALKTYGRIDAAISCAGLFEKGGWFEPESSIEAVQQRPSPRIVEVNLIGSMHFTHVAIPYLKEGKRPEDDKAIVLFSSVAGFKESPGLSTYSVSLAATGPEGRLLRRKV